MSLATMSSNSASNSPCRYELRFRSLFKEGRAYSFPCDAGGHVDLDALSDRARDNYLYVRTVVGREFAMPNVQIEEKH